MKKIFVLIAAVLFFSCGQDSIEAQQLGAASSLQLPDHGHSDQKDGGKISLASFRAYLLSTQTVTCSTPTVVTINQISYDNKSAFNTGTYRYVAPVAGYYLFTINAKLKASTTFINMGAWLRRDGAQYNSVVMNATFTVNNDSTIFLSDIMYLGVGSYADVQVAVGGTGTCSVDALWFTGIMISR